MTIWIKIWEEKASIGGTYDIGIICSHGNVSDNYCTWQNKKTEYNHDENLPMTSNTNL